MPVARIGYVKYLNTLPLVEGLSAWRDVEMVPAAPSLLAGMLADGEVDVALPSVIDFARSPVPLALLPVGMIGSDGPTLTVRLYSAVPWARVGQLHVDQESHTSVVLARVVLRRMHGVSPRVVEFDASAPAVHQWPDTLLMIGDKVVNDPPPEARYPHQLDLGECWKGLTGLPFVYATWMCRAADVAPGSAKRATIATVCDMLQRQRLRNLMRTEWIVERYSGERRWPEDLARRYVTENLRYAVGPREREAVARFFDEAAEAGLAPRARPVWWS